MDIMKVKPPIKRIKFEGLHMDDSIAGDIFSSMIFNEQLHKSLQSLIIKSIDYFDQVTLETIRENFAILNTLLRKFHILSCL